MDEEAAQDPPAEGEEAAAEGEGETAEAAAEDGGADGGEGGGEGGDDAAGGEGDPTAAGEDGDAGGADGADGAAEGEDIGERIAKDPLELDFLVPLPEKVQFGEIPSVHDVRTAWRLGMRKVEEVFSDHITDMHAAFEKNFKAFEDI